MGRSWDEDKGGMLNWVNWLSEVLSEAMRVLKPGACGVVWSLPRTCGWTQLALEMSGFRVIDSIAILNGCLSDDTELFTLNKGWVRSHEIQLRDQVIGYNVDTETFVVDHVKERYVFPYEDTAYRIKSDSTDQIVTADHRVIVEQGGRKVFRQAKTLQYEIRVPTLETLPVLPSDFCGGEFNSSHKEYCLQQDLLKQAAFANNERAVRDGAIDLPRVRQVIPNKTRNDAAWQSEAEVLLQSMCHCGSEKRREDARALQENCSQGCDRLVCGGKKTVKGTNDGEEQSRLERRCDHVQKKGKLQKRPLCQMSSAIFGDGEKGRICNGTPSNHGDAGGENTDPNGGCSSHQSQPGRQPDRELDAVQKQQRPQEIRTWGQVCKTTLATVQPIEYQGIVWCIKTVSGAFVARRNGQIFVTGNSGFPKAQDIGKLIDRELGVDGDREVVERQVYGDGYIQKISRSIGFGKREPSVDNHLITAPASPEAAQWAGWKSAQLKPSHETWFLVQRPISEGSIARNVLAWGVGGLNIEAARIGTVDDMNPNDFDDSKRKAPKFSGILNGGREGQYRNAVGIAPNGRYPANTILTHSPECTPDGCADHCPVTVLGEQSEFIDSKKRDPKGAKYCSDVNKERKGVLKGLKSLEESVAYQDAGTAARYFKQLPHDLDTFRYFTKASRSDRTCNGAVENTHCTVKSRYLMNYFCKLLCPPGGIVLDPFGGSGSTALGALMAGVGYCLIEQDDASVAIANARIEAWRLQSGQVEIGERLQWLETQMQAQDKNIELEKRQLTIFDAIKEHNS